MNEYLCVKVHVHCSCISCGYFIHFILPCIKYLICHILHFVQLIRALHVDKDLCFISAGIQHTETVKQQYTAQMIFKNVSLLGF